MGVLFWFGWLVVSGRCVYSFSSGRVLFYNLKGIIKVIINQTSGGGKGGKKVL